MRMNSKEFKKALDNIVKEKNIDPEVVYSAMELALTSAYKKNFNSKTNVKVLFDRETGEIKVYSYLTVVPDDKMTKEEYEDAIFESYADDEDKDTKEEEERYDLDNHLEECDKFVQNALPLSEFQQPEICRNRGIWYRRLVGRGNTG